MKKILTLFALMLVAIAVNAQSYYYDFDDSNNTATIYYFKESDNDPGPIGALTIPSTVTYNNKSYSVTRIGELAFQGSEYMTSVTIPNSVTSIGNGAFQFCTGLTSMNIPNSVTSIGGGAFESCDGLKSINFGNGIKKIGEAAFLGCESLTSVSIPNSVTSIGDLAFGHCENMKSINIPYGVERIGEWTFLNCYNLTHITIPDNVKSIDSRAFSGCSGLLYISVTPDNTIYDSRDNCNAVVETSTNKLIVGCHNTLIPLSVTSIGKYAFEDCSTLTTINIPNNVTTIGEAAFKGCNNLTSVIIGKSLTSIGDGAFAGCSNLTSITIPYSVMNIGDYAFNSCSSLASVTVKNPSPVNIEQFTFSNRANATLYVPTGAKAAYQAADYWKEFKEIIEVEQSQSTISGDVDGDGTVSVTDVAWIVSHILGVGNNGFIAANADINDDGEIDINDVMATVSIILKGEVVNICPDDNHPHMIDLGLPSGTKWACCNVGADKPDGYGGYYAWGETEEKDVYHWTTYIHCDGSKNTCHDLGSDITGTQYDVAHVKWGGSWVMPTDEQRKELADNCRQEWTTLNDVNGRKFTSKINGNCIFLPAAGYRYNSGLNNNGGNGYYWTATQYSRYAYQAYSLTFSTSSSGYNALGRDEGNSVRPVAK